MNANNRRIVFNGLVFNIEQMDVEIGTCGYHTFQVIRHPGGAGVLPLHGDGSISLISQFRPAAESRLLEIPAGRLSPGEPPVDCARRELQEETGITASDFVPLGKIYSSPGVFDETIHLFAARGITMGTAAPEADEEIEVVRLPFEEALEMSGDGRIRDAKTIAALFRWELKCRTKNT